MNIGTAISSLKAGGRATREGWPIGRYIFDGRRGYIEVVEPFLGRHIPPTAERWDPTHTDLLATDWRTSHDPMPALHGQGEPPVFEVTRWTRDIHAGTVIELSGAPILDDDDFARLLRDLGAMLARLWPRPDPENGEVL